MQFSEKHCAWSFRPQAADTIGGFRFRKLSWRRFTGPFPACPKVCELRPLNVRDPAMLTWLILATSASFAPSKSSPLSVRRRWLPLFGGAYNWSSRPKLHARRRFFSAK